MKETNRAAQPQSCAICRKDGPRLVEGQRTAALQGPTVRTELVVEEKLSERGTTVISKTPSYSTLQ